MLLASERSERDSLRSVQSRIVEIYVIVCEVCMGFINPETRGRSPSGKGL